MANTYLTLFRKVHPKPVADELPIATPDNKVDQGQIHVYHSLPLWRWYSQEDIPEIAPVSGAGICPRI